MKRIIFRLTMPGVASWNGKWSGDGRNYTIVRKMSDTAANKLPSGSNTASWSHHWDDGWSARITASIVAPGERCKKSDGFYGYEWMVSNILCYGQTEKPHKAE